MRTRFLDEERVVLVATDRLAQACGVGQARAALDGLRARLGQAPERVVEVVFLPGLPLAIAEQAEQQREQQLRTGPRAATVNGPKSVADLVQAPAPAAAPRPAPAAPAPSPGKAQGTPAPGMSPTVRAMRALIESKKGTQQ